MEMKSKVIPMLVMALLAAAVNGAAAREGAIDIGPETITMKSLKAVKPAEFPHRKHQQSLVCMQCHHLDGRSLQVAKCHSCHNENFANESLNTMKEVGHALCKDCHKEQRKAGKDIPAKCSTCHPLTIRQPLPGYAQ